MAAINDFKDVGIVDDWPRVSCGKRAVRERKRRVELSKRKRRLLYFNGLRGDFTEDVAEKPLLDGDRLLLRAKHFRLVFLEFRRGEALARRKRLAANVVSGSHRDGALRNLDHETESRDMLYLELRDASPRLLLRLIFREPAMPLVGDLPKFVKFSVVPRRDKAAVNEHHWRIVSNCAVNERNGLRPWGKRIGAGVEQGKNVGNRAQRVSERLQVARVRAERVDLLNKTLEVAHARKQIAQRGEPPTIIDKRLDAV